MLCFMFEKFSIRNTNVLLSAFDYRTGRYLFSNRIRIDHPVCDYYPVGQISIRWIRKNKWTGSATRTVVRRTLHNAQIIQKTEKCAARSRMPRNVLNISWNETKISLSDTRSIRILQNLLENFGTNLQSSGHVSHSWNNRNNNNNKLISGCAKKWEKLLSCCI
jgi:hypothetical protein